MQDFPELDNLTEAEQQEVLKILQEFIDQGTSEELTSLISSDWKEIPCDIETFLHDPEYLGGALIDSEGRFTLFPYWEDLLKKIYPDPLQPAKCNTLALTGSIGIGKSTCAVVIGIYELYRMLCLKDPYVYYQLQPTDLITFAVINITLDAARGVAWDKLQSMIQMSPWFMKHGTLSRSDSPEWKPPAGIELIYGSQTRHIIGRAVFWCFIDEISFQPNNDVEKQKEKAQQLVSTATARMQSRFMRNNVNPTIFTLASSKRTEQSFMETFIANKKKHESKTTFVIDEPQWVIRPDKQSDITFKVAIGNKFLNSEVVPLDVSEEDLKAYISRGYTLIDVPIGYYENFIDDIDIALTDIAGISTSSVTRYFSGPRIQAIKHKEFKNLFTKDVIEVGNAPDDILQYYDFIDLDRLDQSLLSRPMYIHLDMSITGDKTGIAGVWIKGKKPSTEGQPASKDLFYRLAFSVSVKAPKGHQVSFEKNRQFIRWLRERGFNIKLCTSDTFQSADLLQQLSAEGFHTEILSVDRLKEGICLPYQTLKSAIYEERVEIYDEANLLTEELIGLERTSNGHIDHSPAGINSKDQSDAFCGALYSASQHAEEYMYDFGEDYDVLQSVNIASTINSTNYQKQLEVDLQDELVKLFDPISGPTRARLEGSTSQQNSLFYISQGILPF